MGNCHNGGSIRERRGSGTGPLRDPHLGQSIPHRIPHACRHPKARPKVLRDAQLVPTEAEPAALRVRVAEEPDLPWEHGFGLRLRIGVRAGHPADRAPEHPGQRSDPLKPCGVEAGDCQPYGLLQSSGPRLPSSPSFLQLDFLAMDGDDPRAGIPGAHRTERTQHHTGQTRFETTRREKKWCLIVIGGSLTSRSPVGRTGACGLLGTHTSQERAKGGRGALGARLRVRLEIAARSFPRPLPSGSSPPPLSRICSWLFKRRGLLAAHGLRHHLAPGARFSAWTVRHHGGCRGPPASEALLPAARPLQPHGGPYAALVSEPGGIGEGGHLKQPEKAVTLGPQLGLEMDLGGLSG